MIIGYFTPPKFDKRPLSVECLNKEFGKEFSYASKGRYCLYHILISLHVRGPVLLPVYCCSSLLEPLKRLGLEYYFYDISEEDCNADLESVRESVARYNPDCIIAVSMYGNPCCLPELERLCHAHGIQLIDDAAQSVGAEVAGRKVMTFGDAGFFSLSPGKPFAGHLGGFFWSSQPCSLKYIKRPLLHKLVYKDFCLNRLYGIKNANSTAAKVIKRLSSYLQRHIDIANDGYSNFESEVMGGIDRKSVV